MKRFGLLFCMFLLLATSCQKESIMGEAIVYAVPSRVTFYDIYGAKSVQVVSDKSPESDLFLFRSNDSTIITVFKNALIDSSNVRITTDWETIVNAEKLLRLK